MGSINKFYCKLRTYTPDCHSRESGNPPFAASSFEEYGL